MATTATLTLKTLATSTVTRLVLAVRVMVTGGSAWDRHVEPSVTGTEMGVPLKDMSRRSIASSHVDVGLEATRKEFVVSDTDSDGLHPSKVSGQVRISLSDEVGVDVEVGVRD
ncbi:late embryogenesis abundant protein-related [Actinidia rufa]|uniref:Late embryogenesis abundant protein-related n=1 Tax=Actinidia rufa TaxID=165716 RepID=A0A7J0G5E6_9ERIC|nr:late embryogenesis abundant protein-related [Actinidia rufa]